MITIDHWTKNCYCMGFSSADCSSSNDDASEKCSSKVKDTDKGL